MFGVVIGALNLAAFLGTMIGGAISDYASMELCFGQYERRSAVFIDTHR